MGGPEVGQDRHLVREIGLVAVLEGTVRQPVECQRVATLEGHRRQALDRRRLAGAGDRIATRAEARHVEGDRVAQAARQMRQDMEGAGQGLAGRRPRIGRGGYAEGRETCDLAPGGAGTRGGLGHGVELRPRHLDAVKALVGGAGEGHAQLRDQEDRRARGTCAAPVVELDRLDHPVVEAVAVGVDGYRARRPVEVDHVDPAAGPGNVEPPVIPVDPQGDRLARQLHLARHRELVPVLGVDDQHALGAVRHQQVVVHLGGLDETIAVEIEGVVLEHRERRDPRRARDVQAELVVGGEIARIVERTVEERQAAESDEAGEGQRVRGRGRVDQRAQAQDRAADVGHRRVAQLEVLPDAGVRTHEIRGRAGVVRIFAVKGVDVDHLEADPPRRDVGQRALVAEQLDHVPGGDLQGDRVAASGVRVRAAPAAPGEIVDGDRVNPSRVVGISRPARAAHRDLVLAASRRRHLGRHRDPGRGGIDPDRPAVALIVGDGRHPARLKSGWHLLAADCSSERA